MRNKYLLFVPWIALLLVACGTPTTKPTVKPRATLLAIATTSPTAAMTMTPALTNAPTVEATAPPEVSPTNTPTPTSEPTATPTAEPPTATSTPAPIPLIARVEPTLTPRPGEDRIRVSDLPIGEPGNYVNVTFGYWLQYPPDWYTGFGNRPLLVSLSNLDPGSHNRVSMRTEGCLIEVDAASNVYGFTYDDLMTQLPRSFADAERFELGGEPALKVRVSSGENPFDSEDVYVQHDGQLFRLTFEYTRKAAEICRPAWENLLDNWKWFEPEFAVYRNASYGYAISYPQRWYRFNAHARGISISSRDPSGITNLTDLLDGAMLIQTDVIENVKNLPLEEWLAAQNWDIDLADDIPLDEVRGVRIFREGPSPQIREVSGYFQGPLGDIYLVTCLYQAEQEDEFQPIANAIIYSLEF
jgi:hypothetical protein